MEFKKCWNIEQEMLECAIETIILHLLWPCNPSEDFADILWGCHEVYGSRSKLITPKMYLRSVHQERAVGAEWEAPCLSAHVFVHRHLCHFFLQFQSLHFEHDLIPSASPYELPVKNFVSNRWNRHLYLSGVQLGLGMDLRMDTKKASCVSKWPKYVLKIS